MAIADICEIRGDHSGAAQSCERIIELLEEERGMAEEVVLRQVKRERTRLLAKA